MKAFILSTVVWSGVLGCGTASGPTSNPGTGVGGSLMILKSAASEGFGFPGEWEPQESVWLAWPDWIDESILPAEPVYLDMIETLAPVVRVKVLTQDAAMRDRILGLLDRTGISLDNVDLLTDIPYNDSWIRDYGPIFLRSADQRRLAMAMFQQNTWGYGKVEDPEAGLNTSVAVDIARGMRLPGIRSRIVSEGGNRSFNGDGVMICGEGCELQRNPGKTLDQIEAELKRVLGVRKVLWVRDGPVNDQLPFLGRVPGPDGGMSAYTIGTGGHVDEFAAFIDESTILLSEVTEEEAAHCPVARINRHRLEDAFQRLSTSTDASGRPFKLVRIPEAPLLYQTFGPGDYVYETIKDLDFQDGSEFPHGRTIQVMVASSYVNYLVTNDLVLAQSYWEKGMPEEIRLRDRRAMRVLADLYPNRTVVPIRTRAVNSRGGGIHCLTQQQPAIVEKD